MGKICARVYARFLFDRQSQRNQIIYTYQVLCVYMFAYVNVHMMRTRRTKKNATFTHSHSEHLCVCAQATIARSLEVKRVRAQKRAYTHTHSHSLGQPTTQLRQVKTFDILLTSSLHTVVVFHRLSALPLRTYILLLCMCSLFQHVYIALYIPIQFNTF